MTACRGAPPRAAPIQAASPEAQEIEYKIYKQPQAVIYTLEIPKNRRYRINAAASDQLVTVEGFAQKHQALAVINGGFFDPVNQQTTSYVVVNGEPVEDPTQNKRLTQNPDLSPYLAKIFNRSELRQYQCGDVTRYEITLHDSAVPDGCDLKFALGGGPQLLPQQTLIEEGFLDYADGAVTRDPLGSRQRNARSAVGLTEGGLLWVMVAQKQQSSTTTGMSFDELSAFMKQLGVTQAINLDGGTSSSLFYQNKVYTGKSDSSGEPILRPVKSVLMLQDNHSSF
ncbi:MAG: phosphodiester glycosidase family protein [Cyanobacteria bacterium P01_A01_bin.17]